MKSKEPSFPKRTLSSALRSLSRQVNTTRQKSLPFSSPYKSHSSEPQISTSSQSKMFYKRVNPDRIKINPSTAVFDRMANEAKEEGSLRVLRAKGDWYVWPSSANIHTDIIDYFDLADRSKGDMPHVSSAQSKKDPMKMMIGVSLELVSDPDTNHSSMMLMVYSDVIWERDIRRIEKELKKDRKFCEMTKNWKVHNVHGVAKPKTNQGREWLRKRIARDIKLNLAENTSRKEFHPHLEDFIDFACDKLGIFNKPTLKYKTPDDQGEQPSFAAYSPSQKEITIMTKNRHPMDIFRSVAHELVHHKQNEDGKLGKDIAKEGETGSDIENEANSDAGKVMRWFAKANPDMFGHSFVTEGRLIENESDAPDGIIFDGDKKAYVGVQHLKKIQLSPEIATRLRKLVDKYGVWYEGAGKDIVKNKSLFGDKTNYQGAWDDKIAETIKGYPYQFLVVYFNNVKENGTVETFLDPKRTIFDSLLKHQDKKSYFSDKRKFDELTLIKFLKMGSEKGIDFLKLSKLPATRENLTKFFGEGERLTWPSNWLDYPNRLGKMAKKMEEVRNQFLLDQPHGVYVAGSGHIKELLKMKSSLTMIGGDMITEGINDRGIFKAVFLAGGAGSGKDFILSKCIAGNGLQELNSDKAFEMIMKKENFPMVMNGHDPKRDLLRGRAKTVTQHKKGLQLGGRLGVIINGTADDYNKIAKLKQEYENLGYDTMMVFVTTSNKTSRQRNVARGNGGGRTVPENIRFAKWRGANVNKDKFAQLFGSNFIQIDNDADLRNADPQTKARYDKMHTEVFRKVRAFVSKPVANPRSKTWLDAEKRARGISEMDEKFMNLMEVGGAGNWGTPQLTDRYKRDTPGETPGKTKEMGYHDPKENSKIGIHPYMADGNSVKVFGNLPIKGDRVGSTYTSAKNPSFVGDTTSDPNSAILPEPFSKWSPIDRWSVNEETKKRFKARYGELAEQKIRETVNKLKESLTDFEGGGVTPNSSNRDVIDKPDINAEFEKVALFGKKHKKTKYIKK